MAEKTNHLWMIPTGLALVLVLLGGIAIAVAGHFTGVADEQRAWPTTPGVVVTNSVSSYQVRDAKSGFWVDRTSRTLEYTYEVDGREYTGNAFGFGDHGHVDFDAQYPVGTPVTVHYDPADPTQAALFVDHTLSPTPFYVLAGGLFVLALPFGYLAYRLAIARPKD